MSDEVAITTDGVCSFCDPILGPDSGTQSTFGHHPSMQSLKESQIDCWLCALFVKSLLAAPSQTASSYGEGLYSTSALFRNAANPGWDRICIKMLPPEGFSAELGLRRLGVERGYGSSLKRGKAVLVLTEGPCRYNASNGTGEDAASLAGTAQALTLNR